MAAEGELSTFFPIPPPFFKSFTSANRSALLDLGTTLESPHDEQGQSDEAIGRAILQLPLQVRHLIPPRPPADGIHTSFNAQLGGPQPTLASMGAEPLLPSTSAPVTSSDWTTTRSTHLKSLTQSIMLNFLELLGTLSVHPDGHAADKIADLEVLFLNAHNIIDEYRPHQARDDLIRTMRRRLEGLEGEIAGVHKMKHDVEELIASLQEGSEKNGTGAQDIATNGTDGKGLLSERRDGEIWAALADEIPG